MSCNHPGCYIHSGCGIDHPQDWTPTMTILINGHEMGGDDAADAAAHYLLSLGYPTDRPDRLRRMGEQMIAKYSPPPPKKRIVTQK